MWNYKKYASTNLEVTLLVKKTLRAYWGELPTFLKGIRSIYTSKDLEVTFWAKKKPLRARWFGAPN